jgi:hypothetical protein
MNWVTHSLRHYKETCAALRFSFPTVRGCRFTGTHNAHPMLLKHSPKSEPQGRVADFSSKWIFAAMAFVDPGAFLATYGETSDNEPCG